MGDKPRTAAGAKIESEKRVGTLNAELASAYSACKTNERFLGHFGSVGSKKLGFVLVMINATFMERISSYAKDKQSTAKSIPKARTSEYRKARALSLTIEQKTAGNTGKIVVTKSYHYA